MKTAAKTIPRAMILNSIPSLRKLFYILVSKEVIPNLKKTYRSLDNHMTELRNEGILPTDCLSDQKHPIIDINDVYYSSKDWIKFYIKNLRILLNL
jgi:hypothetical protein